MKRIFMLLSMTVFICMVISSCTPVEKVDNSKDRPPALEDKPVMIITRGQSGLPPKIVPEFIVLRSHKREQVKWFIDDDELNFTIKFEKNGTPFTTDEFGNSNNASGQSLSNPGNKPQIKYYSVYVEGFPDVDPGIIWW